MRDQMTEEMDAAAVVQAKDAVGQEERRLERYAVEPDPERLGRERVIPPANIIRVPRGDRSLVAFVERYPVVVENGEGDDEEDREREQRAPMRRKRSRNGGRRATLRRAWERMR